MNRIKKLRLEKNLLQSDIAKIIHKTDRAVGQYEREERDPSSETWIQLANFFDVSLDYLLGKTDIRNIGKKFDQILNESMLGISMEEYEALSEEKKEKIRTFVKYVRDIENS